MQEVGTWAQVLIALVGVALASLPQLTYRARLRNRISFWTSQVQGTDLEHDRKIAESLRRDATGRLLALDAYPAWRFLIAAYSILAGLLTAMYFGYQIARSYPNLRPLRSLIDPNDVLPVFTASALGFLFIWQGLFELKHVILSRRRLAARYLKAETLSRAEATRDVRSSRKMGWLNILGLLVFSVGIYVLTIGASIIGAGLTIAMVEGIPIGDVDPRRWRDGVPIFMLGSLVMAFGLYSIAMFLLADQKEWEWKHPRPLNEVASAVQTKLREEPEHHRKGPWWQRGT